LICIKNGKIIDGEGKNPYIADILIKEEKVFEIGPDLSNEDMLVIDAKGKLILPGFVDAHCHLRDPGFEHKEDILSGMRSAAAGGFTSVACMANTNPVVDNMALVEYILAKSAKFDLIKVYPIAAVTKGLAGQELTNMAELKAAGAIALSDDGKPISSSAIMKTALEYSSAADILIISHCEDLTLVADGVMNEGTTSTILGLKGISNASEEAMVARDIILSETTGVKIHIAHISTKGSVELIRQAKKRGVKVTCETAPHYFSSDDSILEGYNTNAKVNPPIRSAEDVKAIVDGIVDGTVDIIATDHAPHHKDDKNVEFALAANGLTGFELAFPLSYTNLVLTNKIDIAKLVELMSTKPSEILNINSGKIQKNSLADIVIVDHEKGYKVEVEKFFSKGKNTPFNGYTLKGQITHTISKGKLIFENGKFV